MVSMTTECKGCIKGTWQDNQFLSLDHFSILKYQDYFWWLFWDREPNSASVAQEQVLFRKMTINSIGCTIGSTHFDPIYISNFFQNISINICRHIPSNLTIDCHKSKSWQKNVGIRLHTAFFDLYTAHIPKFLYSVLYTVNFGFEFFNDFCIPVKHWYALIPFHILQYFFVHKYRPHTV